MAFRNVKLEVAYLAFKDSKLNKEDLDSRKLSYYLAHLYFVTQAGP